ncbi:MAG TPA: hypothetical protein VM097_14280 [Mycobacteriales bacterium]|nr:hypothetical protein [Mycobacteriales bacterium]
MRWLSVWLLALATACSQGPASTAGGPTRDGAIHPCPEPRSAGVPSDLPLVDRETLNLGAGVLGHEVVYQRTQARRVVITVGRDVLDDIEDLDVETTDETLGGKQVRLSTTLLQPSLQVAEVLTPLPEECGPLYVVAERLRPAELQDVLRRLVLAPPVGPALPG